MIPEIIDVLTSGAFWAGVGSIATLGTLILGLIEYADRKGWQFRKYERELRRERERYKEAESRSRTHLGLPKTYNPSVSLANLGYGVADNYLATIDGAIE